MSEEIARAGIVTTCIVCGAELAPRKYKFCSKRCLRTSYRRRHRDVVNGYASTYRNAHKKEVEALRYFRRIRENERLEADSERYARLREVVRRNSRLYYERKHPGCRPYRPNMNTRIPDWAVKGQDVIDRGSVFLSGNMSDEQIMANKAFVLEQNATEDVQRPRVKTFFRGR